MSAAGIRRWRGSRLLRSPLESTLLSLLALPLVYVFATTPLDAVQQAVLAVVGFVMLFIATRIPGRGVTIFLALFSIMVSVRYIFWRVTDTLEFDGFWQTFFGTGLVLAEVYAVTVLALSYFQTIWPLDRKPVPMPADIADWPVVDVYIPTYNEALEIVKPSVYAALALDYPPDKLNVYILDDGRREEFRLFAEACGANYMIRPDNKGAKAGNINHALGKTKGEFITIFDCDHVPTRAFLQLTLGWMLRDRRLAMIQTPHHFYSPDPFERNLHTGKRTPNEGLLFYGLVQQGNDLWNATFFCGSCAVIRRTALEEVGGVPHATVTEDCHCSLKMQRRGWNTAYLRLPLAAGLATERLMLHIGQRSRWARGMVQILRIENPLFADGLSLPQRLCYFMAMFSFLFPLPRLVFLTSPLAYLLFGQSVIAASPLAIVAYAAPHIVHSVATASRMQSKVRHSFWSEIYEAVLALWLVPVTLATLVDPTRGKFNVTDKGGMLQEGFLDLRAVGPNAVLGLVLLVGILIGIHGAIVHPVGSIEFQAYLLNAIWATFCLVTVGAGIAVGRERRQVRERARVAAVLPAVVHLPDGRLIEGRTHDLSLGGAALTAERPATLEDETPIRIELDLGPDRVLIPGQVLRWHDGRLQIRFTPQDIRDEGQIVRAVLCRADAWVNWDDNRPDRPFRSFLEVMLNIAALFTGGAQFSPRGRRARDRRPPTGGARAETPSRVPAAGRAAVLLLGLLASAVPRPAQAQGPQQLPPAPPARAVPTAPAPAPVPASPAPPAVAPAPDAGGSRRVTRTLRQLGLGGPMQLRGTSDLQGVLFGVRGDEVVTDARLTVQGATSPALIPELSQLAITLNDQFVGAIQPDRARPTFGPTEFPLNPVFFTDANRLNFRFSGRYAVECNDPLSGLLWTTVSELSTVQLTLQHLPIQPDLSRLPEPFFDPRVLRTPLRLPVVLPETAGNDLLRAAAIATSWFAVQADYRGADFPVQPSVPPQGNAVVLATGPDSVPGVALPRVEGPTLALVPNPNDPEGLLLVIAGRSAAEAATAAAALVAGNQALAGETAAVQVANLPPRQPYDAPRWIRTDRPVRFAEIMDPSELQAGGYSPGAIAVPFRTAPDLYTWRNRSMQAEIRYRSPPGPVLDLAVSRLDASVNGIYLRSFPLIGPEPSWPWSWLQRQLGYSERRTGTVQMPPYLLFGQNELQLRFDMRPLNRGDCVAVPGDIRAAVDPDSTIDLSRGYRFAVLPNLAMFASSGFPYTRMADLSETAFVLPDRPNTAELTAFLGLVGRLAATVGLPATGLTITRPGGLETQADKDLVVIGALNRQPALTQLLRDAPIQAEGNRISVNLPDAMANFRHLFWDGDVAEERARASALLAVPADGLGALIGFESPLRSGRSVLALTGATPQAVEQMLAVLRDPNQLSRIQGDLAILSGGQVSSFRVGGTYAVGSLPFWLWPQYWLGGRPELLLASAMLAAMLISIPIYWAMRRRAARRLRARTV
ncbi:UDP-forming cellulose synthase catalytic subunit [Roseomonas sp. NAR14]|uniref:Cellulose synthase catalytic subunit [UDP-forming] n=1 Tax=Roseomonas acroporae TaxID=2937791 RepID=A0A9X2BVT3_9PROT|nr:UDP-forming cellulose synthase catalytic subunit [Roseomonas acroporae]MCK8784319.1 UDP-forming cellulose synthase catalytic subunit [Roseomonas acroporae]